MTYDKDMAEDHPEALFQQKVPQVYLDLQEAVRKVKLDFRVQQQPPVMRSEQFRWVLFLRVVIVLNGISFKRANLGNFSVHVN